MACNSEYNQVKDELHKYVNSEEVIQSQIRSLPNDSFLNNYMFKHIDLERIVKIPITPLARDYENNVGIQKKMNVDNSFDQIVQQNQKNITSIENEKQYNFRNNYNQLETLQNNPSQSQISNGNSESEENQHENEKQVKEVSKGNRANSLSFDFMNSNNLSRDHKSNDQKEKDQINLTYQSLSNITKILTFFNEIRGYIENLNIKIKEVIGNNDQNTILAYKEKLRQLEKNIEENEQKMEQKFQKIKNEYRGDLIEAKLQSYNIEIIKLRQTKEKLEEEISINLFRAIKNVIKNF